MRGENKEEETEETGFFYTGGGATNCTIVGSVGNASLLLMTQS
jgi:hypothetical protein